MQKQYDGHKGKNQNKMYSRVLPLVRGDVKIHCCSPHIQQPSAAICGKLYLRLDNTGAWVVWVNPWLLCNGMSENIDLYIKLKLGIFSIIWYNSHSKVLVFSQVINLKVIFQLFFFPWSYLTHFSIKMNETFRVCTEGIYVGKSVSDFVFNS